MIARYSLSISAIAVYFLILPVVVTDEDPELFIYSIRPTKETELVWAIKCSRFIAIPVWRAGAEEAPPLSPNEAIAVANKYVQNGLGVHGASILSINIRSIGYESENRWMYDID
jgi:hypothetical protein